MIPSSAESRRRYETLNRTALGTHQLKRFNEMLSVLLPSNRFYAEKLARFPKCLESLEQLAELPMTSKEELLSVDAHQPLPMNLTYPLEKYVRFHQTSGTHGRPLAVYDTVDDWQWWIDCWQYVLDAAQITEYDRVLLAFSFGPFIGFWSAYEAIVARGGMVIPGGGMDTRARLDLMNRSAVTALFCTPTYAMHMVEVAEAHNVNLATNGVRTIVVAGEPGGSVPATRQRIEAAWDARVIDHCGASEVGPWGYADHQQQGLHVLESEFIAEFISVETGQQIEPSFDRLSTEEGPLAHLVLTSLGRYGMPVIRYRTCDLVHPQWVTNDSNQFVLLRGGVLGRADDMMVVRGVNIFPSSIEQILRSFPEVLEFRITVRKQGEMDELVVEVEDRLQAPDRIAKELQLQLGLKVEVRLAAAMSLPRSDGKGQRFVDLRKVK
jgi:phenylacetate-CoA ligase